MTWSCASASSRSSPQRQPGSGPQVHSPRLPAGGNSVQHNRARVAGAGVWLFGDHPGARATASVSVNGGIQALRVTIDPFTKWEKLGPRVRARATVHGSFDCERGARRRAEQRGPGLCPGSMSVGENAAAKAVATTVSREIEFGAAAFAAAFREPRLSPGRARGQVVRRASARRRQRQRRSTCYRLRQR